MDLDSVFSRLAAGLSSSGYHFRADDLTPQAVEADDDRLGAAVRGALEVAADVTRLVGGAPGAFALHASGDARKLQEMLDEIRGYAPLAAYRFVLGQPYAVAAVGADGRGDDELVQVAARFDSTMLRMRELSAIMGGIQLGKVNLLGARLSVTGILLFVFLDPAAASRFVATTRARCKFSHFWKKTHVLPWVVDVPRGQVVRHAGLPFILGRYLDPAVLAAHVFAAGDAVAPAGGTGAGREAILPHGGAGPV
jgi:hypothetical protein